MALTHEDLVRLKQIAQSLPPDKLTRLIEIKKAYPGVALTALPEPLMREVIEIMQSLGKTAHQEDSQPAPRQTPGQGETTKVDKEQHERYSIIGTDSVQKDMDVAISQKSRLQGLYIIGANGTGKSTLLAHLILQDIQQGLGVCLIEPHGDLTNTVLGGLPRHRLKDVILLDVSDVDYPFGLNLFECSRLTIRDMAKTATFVSHVFEKIWGAGTDTPRLMQNLRAVTRTLIENPGTTLAEIPLLYSNEAVRVSMVDNLSNPSVISYWEDYQRKSERDRDIYLESTLNKVNAFLDEPMIRNIFAQEKTTIDFRTIMDSGKILLIKLSPQFEEASRLIGAVMIGKLLLAAFSRADTPEHKRKQFSLYCDEFQRFATSDFATLISEARKFRIATTLSHQTLSQLDAANRTAALAAGNLVVFRVSGEDAENLANSFDTTPTQEQVGEEPIRAPVSDVISHLVKRGHGNSRVTRFAQSYLKNLDDFIHKTAQDEYYLLPWDCLSISLTNRDILKGREELNTTLYRCMSEGSAHFLIPPLALYMLSVAQQDGREYTFYPFIKLGSLAPPYYQPGYLDLQEFKEESGVFGHLVFISEEYAAKFIASRERKGFFGSVTRESQQQMEAAKRVIHMITELRYTMEVLTTQPILVDTGQYQAKYQNRTFADRENEIARDLTQQPNFQAKAKLLSGECVFKTKPAPYVLSGSQLTARLHQIQEQMRSPERRICRAYQEVEQEIRERQEKLQSNFSSHEPPPTHY